MSKREFDESEAMEEFWKQKNTIDGFVNTSFVKGAHWRFDQDSKEIERLEKENETLNEKLRQAMIAVNKADDIIKERDVYLKALEKLKENLEASDEYMGLRITCEAINEGRAIREGKK